MSFNVAGRGALITGAASGIGLAASRSMLGKGLQSLVAYDLNPSLPDVAEELRKEFPGTEIITHVADVTDPTSLQAAFATPLDGGRPLTIVSNNAGIGGADWEKTLAVDLSAVIMGTSMGLARFKKEAAGGVIVNVASMAGLAPMSFDPVYTAAKHGVVGYSRCFQHLIKKGIRVNCLCPAFTDTPLVQGLVDDPKFGPAGKMAIESLGGLIPMENVVSAFMGLVENEDNNGAVMTVTNAHGIMPMKFPLDP
ncbi:hypothetical protein TrST_g2961 [Triparma strigata]|uniref:Uncharacterized protein n=1 Tax=Triparma strigata TaxID=1606541 RepID=A0A9W7AYY3_9STRA|nr:hypothetical protein TrST_g2961 [Triparma strigata]